MISKFFEESNVSKTNVVIVGTNKACYDRLLFRVCCSGQAKNLRIPRPRSLFQRQALASKTLLRTSNTVLKVVISIVSSSTCVA